MAPLSERIAHHREELVRQRDLLRGVPPWYLAPFLPGILVLSSMEASTLADGLAYDRWGGPGSACRRVGGHGEGAFGGLAPIKENSAAARQIAASVAQQAAGLRQIFTTVTDLSDMMNQTQTRLASTKRAVETVKAVSVKISDIVKNYQV